MAVKLFGFKIGRDDEQESLPTFAPPDPSDGAMVVEPGGWSAGGAYSQYIDLQGIAKSEAELVTKYRHMAIYPECEYAIDDITNETIICEENKPSVSIVLDNLKQPQSIKTKIRDEFDEILHLLDFKEKGYDIFRRWYVDGRIYYHVMIDIDNPRFGIQELRPIDARKIRLVREIQRGPGGPAQGLGSATDILMKKSLEYYIWNPNGISSSQTSQGLKVAKDSICHVTSGLVDVNKTMVIGHLHPAIKPLNQLRMIEDSVVIYRLSRAPERRIFYVDVGNLPKAKAEQYLKDIMTRFKNKLIYDANTGTIQDDRQHRTMLEDYWLPRREGGRGTEVTTLPGGQNLGEIEDIEYFQRKLYKALKIPITRLQSETGFSLGRSTEITRDEVKFSKFVTRLRQRFAFLFSDLLQKQLRLKGIITEDDWLGMKDFIEYDYLKNVHFAELQESEIMRNRLEILREIDEYNGKYYSTEWIRKNILQQTDKDITVIDRQIKSQEEPSEMASQEGPPEEQPPPPPQMIK